MANSTVYPYGTGGSLPSSIGLINDLKTGGADKALAASQGPVIVDLIDEVALGSDWVTEEIHTTWTDGALIAQETDSNYGTLESNSNWKTSDYIEVGGYTHLKYGRAQANSSSNIAARAGVVFYDTNKAPLMGFIGGYGTTTADVITIIPIPSNAVYVRIPSWSSGYWSGTRFNYLAKETGFQKGQIDFYERVSDLGIVGRELALSIPASGETNIIRNVVGNYVCEYRTGSISNKANRFYIDIRQRDYSKTYLVHFKYACTRSLSDSIYVTLKDADYENAVTFSNPNRIIGTSYSQINRNGNPSGEFIGIIPSERPDLAYISFDSHSVTTRALMVFSDIYINELDAVYNLQNGIPLWRTGVEYSGEKVNLRNRVFAERIMRLSSTTGNQAACAFGDYGFQWINNGARVVVFNLKTRSTIQDVTMSGDTVNGNNHCNSAFFSKEYYASGDEFPIMYESTGYAIDGMPRCYGYRIVRTVENDVETFTITHVHTISINHPTWTEFVSDGRYLYIRFASNGEKIGKVLKPLASDGDATIEMEDLQPIVPFDNYLKDEGNDTQGFFFHNDRIYTAWGSSAPFYLGVVNPETGRITTVIPLADLNISYEPESLFISDNHLYFNTYTGYIYKLFFD